MDTYQCLDCDTTSDGTFTGGKCSKCGSFNIKNINRRKRREEKTTADFKKTFLMMLLWGFIIYQIWLLTQ